MIDLVDASLAHKIITCADVMGGNLGIEEIQRAKEKILESEETELVDEALAEAAKEIREEREASERASRALIAARAKYTKRRVDSHAPSAEAGIRPRRKGARMLFGKFRGMLVEDVPTWYLDGCLSGKPFIAHNWLRSAINKEVGKRKAMEGGY
jgi:ATPase subunit of ABC transporter with duplicated ATPase domains